MQVAKTALLDPEKMSPLGSLGLRSPMQAGGHLAWPLSIVVLFATGLLIFAEGPVCLKLEKAQRMTGIDSKLRVTAFQLLLWRTFYDIMLTIKWFAKVIKV